MAEDLYPNSGAKHHQHHGGQQTQPAAQHRTTRGQFRPVHGKQDDREVTARSDCKRQTDHEGDVLIFEQHAENDGDDAQHQNGDFRHPQLFTFGRTLAEHVRVEIVRDRRGARQRQTGDDGQNSGERHR